MYLVVENIQFTKKEKQCNNLLGFFSNLCIQDSGDKWKSVQLKYFSQFFIYSNFIALCEEYRDVGAATILLLQQQQLAFVFIWEFNGTPPIGLKPQVLNFSSAASSLPFLSLLTFEMRINGEGEPQLVCVYFLLF